MGQQRSTRKSPTGSTLSSRYEFDMPSTRLQVNGIHHSLHSDDDDAALYRSKYERALADLDFAKRQIVEQHEEDMEQLMILKKQLEKKINEAYDEVDDEKNDLLERKFRKVDAELMEIQQEIHREASVRNRLEKDMEALRQDKTRLNDDIHQLRLEVETKEGKIRSLSNEINDLQDNTVNEEEVRRLK